MSGSTHARGSSKRTRFGFRILLFCACLVFVVSGFRNERVVLGSRDFKPLYGSSRCLVFGCNPYDEAQTRAQYVAGGGSAADPDTIIWKPFNALYPPPSLFVALPVTMLPFSIAHLVWLVLGAAMFVFAAFLIEDLCAPYPSLLATLCLCALVASSTILIMLGQPTMLALSLCTVALWTFLRNRAAPAGMVCLAISLLLKPQLAIALWLYCLTQQGVFRRRAVQAAGLAALVAAAGCALCYAHPASRDWVDDLRINVAGNATPGGPNDPSPADTEALNLANMQALTSFVSPRPAVFSALALGLTFVLLVTLVLELRRLQAPLMLAPEEKRLLTIAAVATLSLLPLYHRQYDTRILLLTIPAVAVLLRRNRSVGIAATLLTMLAVVCTSHSYLTLLARHLHPAQAAPWTPERIFLLRPLPEMFLLLTVFYLWVLWLLGATESRGRSSPPKACTKIGQSSGSLQR